MKFVLLTDEDGDKIVVGFGTGGYVSARRWGEETVIEDSDLELYVKETPEEIYSLLKKEN